MVTINADTDALKRFSRKLRKTYPEVSKALKAEVAAAGQLVRDDARARAGEFSKKIPPTIRSRVTGTMVTVTVGTAAQPLGALYERTKNFRHPVMGNRNVWVEQAVKKDGTRGPNAGPKRSLHDAFDAQVEPAKERILLDAIDKVIGGEA